MKLKLTDTVTVPGYKDPYMKDVQDTVDKGLWFLVPQTNDGWKIATVTPKEVPYTYGIDTIVEDNYKAMTFFNHLLEGDL